MTTESCTCKANEKEKRTKITIAFYSPREITVTVHSTRGAKFSRSENVRQKSTCSLLPIYPGNTYEKLRALGQGIHEICWCHTIGPADAVAPTKKATKKTARMAVKKTAVKKKST